MASQPSDLTVSIEALLAASRARDAAAVAATSTSSSTGSPTKDEAALRRRMLELTQEIQYRLVTPREALFRQLTNYSETAVVRSLRQIGALEKIPREGSISAKELADRTGANEEVLLRFMRILTATGILDAHGPDTFGHTANSLIYLDGAEVEFWDLCVDEVAPVAFAMPAYLAAHERDAILDPRRSPFVWHNQAEGRTFYEFLLEHPARLRRFNTAMTTEEQALPVLGMFPFASLIAEEEELIRGNGAANENRVFFVDVAGGQGQSLLQIRRELAAAPGSEELLKRRFVLQDRQKVLDAVPDDALPGVEKMAIDFFERQPITAARIYYLRRILHNWQDAECLVILRHLALSMAVDSRLLIGEMVVPARATVGGGSGGESGSGGNGGSGGVDRTVYWMDLCMLAIGGKERTARDFAALVQPVGLALRKIWPLAGSCQVVLECVLRKPGEEQEVEIEMEGEGEGMV